MSICPYELGGRVATFPCKECKGRGTLDSIKCRAGVIRVLAGEHGLDLVVLAEYNETMYSSEAVEVLALLGDMVRELDALCEERFETRSFSSIRCGKCPFDPGRLYPKIRRLLFVDLGKCYDAIRQPLLEKQPEDKACSSCSEGARDRLFFLLHMVEEARRLVLRRGLGVIVEEKEEERKKGPKAKKDKSAGSRKLLKGCKGVDVSNLQSALNAVFTSYKRIRPCFSNAWLDPLPPKEGVLVRGKHIDGARVRLLQLPSSSQSFYHLLPGEYRYKREDVQLIQDMREELLSREMRDVGLGDQEAIRTYIEHAAVSGLTRMLRGKGMSRLEAANKAAPMAKVLARYTAGMGVLEYVLRDDNVQDVYVDAPSHQNPVHLTTSVSDQRLVGKMITNMVLDRKEMETTISRLRHIGGLPFSEAAPILETDLATLNTRATAIGPR